MKSIATREKSNCRRNSSSLDFNQPFATYATSNSNRRSLNQPTRENSTLWLVKFLQRRRTQNCLTRLHLVFSFYFLCGHLKIAYSALFGFISGKTKNFSSTHAHCGGVLFGSKVQLPYHHDIVVRSKLKYAARVACLPANTS